MTLLSESKRELKCLDLLVYRVWAQTQKIGKYSVDQVLLYQGSIKFYSL